MTASPTGETPLEPTIPEELREFGHYALEKELGRGAQGVVYLAEDLRLRRKVALKVLTSAGARSLEVRERFRREAEIASKLVHPGLCGVYEVGEVRGIPYIAMQYLRGTTLAALVQYARNGSKGAPGQGKLDPGATTTSLTGKDAMQDVLRLIEQAARALHAAHEVGLVHRDVKPGNIMIAPDGQPVLLDFGLARDIEDQGHTITETGAIMGTPAYMAAEQLRAQRDQVDRRTDVYALGVILYECLTLKLPFDGASFEVLYNQILQGTPTNPQKLNPRIPTDLRTVIEVAMERDRARRYPSALELAEDLRRVRTFEPIHAKAAGPLLRARKWARREPAKAVGLSGLAVFALSGAGFLVSQRVERLHVARAHLERAQTLLAAGDFNGALESVAQSRERAPDSTAALELKARIEAARDAAARDERKASDLRGSAAAREESAQKQQEYAALRTEVRPLQQRSREQRARVFGAYATDAARASLANLESELGQRRMQGERLLQEAQESLERAARLAAPWGETVETEQAFAAFYLERWREAADEGDAPRATLFRALVERHDTQHALASELLGLGQLRVSIDPPGAEVYLFRYESLEHVRPGPCIPRLVPVPTRGTGVAREGPWAGDFYAGDPCLCIAAVEPGSAAAAAGLRPGDLVLRLGGQPVGDGLFVAAREVPEGVAPLARVGTLNGSAIASRFDWSTVAPAEAGKSDQVGFFGRAGTLACDRSLLTLESAENLIANGCPGVPFKILCLHAGEPLELEVGGTNSGLRCERTAYPLICSPGNRIEAGVGSAVDPGSYLLLARAAEREEQRFAVLVPRLGQIEVRLSLLPAGATPAGFVYIPPGSFIYGGDPEAIESVPLERPELAGYCIGRREVTNAEWAEFVDDAATQEAIQAAGKPKYFSREQSGVPVLVENRGGPSTPVMGIPWNEVRDFLAWRNRKAQHEGDPLRYDLPSEQEWEKAARGVDGRAFPWGNRFDFDLVVGLHSKPTALFSAPGGFEPCDESPFGVQDAGGLRQEWTNARKVMSDPSAPPLYFKRGGCWIFTRDALFRSASRAYQDATIGGGSMGFRLVARPASGSAAPTGPANR